MSNLLLIPPISSLHRYLVEARESVLAERNEYEKLVSITPEHRRYNSVINYSDNAADKKS